MKTIRIIATSDLHGRFYPWDYSLNMESRSGSMAQLACAIADYRNEDSILVDAGDTIQDNFSDIFMDEEIHPMIRGINDLKYDVWVTGNHDYNYGMEVLKKTISDLKASVLVGNVYDEKNNSIADGYKIFNKNGVRVAVIGMVTPNIVRWDATHLKNCRVTDPLEETRNIIERIKGGYDVLVGVFHMGLKNEYGVKNSGTTDICNSCPEFDVIVSSHEHALIQGQNINDVLVVQNKCNAETMSVINLKIDDKNGKMQVSEKTAQTVCISEYAPDKIFLRNTEHWHLKAISVAEEVIGELSGCPLAPPDEIDGIPSALIQHTALIDLINAVQIHYSGAGVSATSLCKADANIFSGEIKKCDVSNIYKYSNTLYKLRMTGSQLRKYMEWCAVFYNKFNNGDLTISFNPDIPLFKYDLFDGVNYDINISKDPWHRIENLTWPDGTPVLDDDEFFIAVNDYRANSQLLAPGEIFQDGDLPVLEEPDIRGDLGGIRELICDYIVNVKKGVINPLENNNWKLTGYSWDSEKRNKALKLLGEGRIKISGSDDGRHFNIRTITEEDIR